MTLSAPAHSRLRLRRLSAGLARVVALAFAVVLLAVPTGAWAATDGPPETSPATFTMAPRGGGLVAQDQPVTVTAEVHNPADSTIASGAVRLSSSATPLRTRAEVDAWLTASADGASVDAARTERALSEGVIPGVAAHGTGTIDVSIDPATLADLAPGVYPLRADYAGPQGTVSAVSVLVVPGEAGTGALGVVVPITAPPIAQGLLDAARLATLTAPGGALRARLDAVTGTSAILAVDPAIVAAIRVLGSSAPESAVTWLDDLMSLPNSRFALQFGDADLATQIAAGETQPLGVRTLASSPSADASAGTPTPTPTPDESTLPTFEALTDVGAAAGPVFWPATGTAGAEVVAALGPLTVDDVPSITLLDSAAVTSDAAVPAWATAGDARVLVYDAPTSTALAVAASSADALTRAGAVAEASAYAALAAAASPDTPLLVAVDRSSFGSPEALRSAVAAATSLGGRAATDLAALTAGSAVAISPVSVPASPESVAGFQTLLDDEASLTSFATILADPIVLTGPERASILQLIGNGWRADPAGAADAFDAHRAQTAATLASVAVVPPSDITFAATSAPLTFSVRNDLPWPVSLVLITTQNDPRLIVQNTTPVEAGAAQNTRVQVPVEARVGSGESTLTLQLRSPSMVAIGDAVPVHVAVRAEWESVGLIVMIALVAGLIVVGIIRTVRRLRRGAQADPDAATPADGADATATGTTAEATTVDAAPDEDEGRADA